MSDTVRLTLPASEEQVRRLRAGDIVYLTGRLFTLRDMAHRRAVDLLDEAKPLPVDIAEGALWHCGPIASQDESGRWQLSAAGSTTSSRFSVLGAELIRRLSLRIVLGKGTMGQAAIDAMRGTGCVFLNSTGGCAALYAEQIKQIEAVHWYDLGMPEAIWVMQAVDMGPFTVGIDSHGNSLYSGARQRVAERLPVLYRDMGLERSHAYSFLPKHTPGNKGRE